MASAYEKSLAVECMHRLNKHMNDALGTEGAPLNTEIFEIHQVWDLREHLEGDLNACLATLRQYRNVDGTLQWKRLGEMGWRSKGRKGLTTG